MKRFPFPLDAEVPLYLAPMAGVSESPFRRLCRRFGADVVVTEFLSAEGIRRENPATISKLRFGPDERPIGVQIFGADPAAMGEAAAFVTDVFAPEFIDINFGCPVKKVVKRNGGSGCLKDLDLVQEVIRAVARSTSPARDVQDPQRLERGDARSGHDRAPLPGRRRARARAASAHAHADVLRPRALGRDRRGRRRARHPGARQRRHQDAARRVCACGSETRLRRRHDRARLVRPAVDLRPDARSARRDARCAPTPSVEERFAIALEHARMANDYEPDRKGAAIEFRKHLGWYVKGLPGSAELRKRLHAVTSLGEVEGIFADYLADRDALRRRSVDADGRRREPLETAEV